MPRHFSRRQLLAAADRAGIRGLTAARLLGF